MHRVTVELGSGQDNRIYQASSPGEFDWPGWIEGLPGDLTQTPGEFYKVLKFYVGIIFVISIELLKC